MPDIMTQTYDKYIKQTSNARKIKNQKTTQMLNGVSNTARLNKILNNIMGLIDHHMNRSTADISSEEARINKLNLQMFDMTNDFNANEAQKARDYTEYMSSSAHQREVNDLKAAGLNPVLSAGGQGASTPSASNASSGNWQGATESALNAMATMAKAEMDNKTSLTSARINAQTQKEIAGAQVHAGLLESYNNMLATLLSNKGSYKASMTSARYGLAGMMASAGATEAAAAMAAGASYNMAASQLAGVKYSADQSLAGKKYASDNSYAAALYGADQGLKNSLTGAMYSALYGEGGHLNGKGFKNPIDYGRDTFKKKMEEKVKKKNK